MNYTVLRCWYCNRTGDLHDDHVVPRSRGGPDTPNNIVKACKRCNSSKGDQLPSEWLLDVPPAVAEIERRVSASMANRIKARRDRQRKRVPVAECYFCAGLILDAGDACLEFCDQEQGPPFGGSRHVRILPSGAHEERGELCYPGHGQARVRRGHWFEFGGVAIVSHLDCGPDVGYSLLLSRLSNYDNMVTLRHHIMSKPWAWEGIVDAMAVIHERLAQAAKRSRFHQAHAAPSDLIHRHDLDEGIADDSLDDNEDSADNYDGMH